jgi:GNAT superfamily N-acetyltransferase
MSMDEIETTVTYLEMRGRPDRRQPSPLIAPLALTRAERMTVPFYRYLYHAVGNAYHWVDRTRLSDEALGQEILRPEVEIWVLNALGVPAGYFELEAADSGVVTLVYFGLIPEFLGQGLGAFLLSEAIHRAWDLARDVVRVETCTLDHPAALPLYQKFGFEPYGQERKRVPVLQP